MRRYALAIILLLSAAASTAWGGGQATWVVSTPPDLDRRLQRQIQDLAVASGVKVQFAVAGKPQPRVIRDLRIELETIPASALLSEFKQRVQDAASPANAGTAGQGYLLRCVYSDKSELVRIRIQSASAAGAHNALLRVPDLLSTAPDRLSKELIPHPQSMSWAAAGRELDIADYPSFPLRGVVEGFYGTPWSHADRLDVLRFEGRHGMNTYVYGPKDDPYHRKLWRDPYPPDQLKQMAELAATAHDNFVDFTFAISPGLSMTYTSDADFETLLRKIQSVANLGVSNFALFLDDVPQDLVHPEDKGKFRSLAEAHIYLINRLYDRLKSLSPQNRLTACPTTYTHEWGNRDYIRELGEGVRPEVPLYWTGTEVIPKSIRAAEADEWATYIRRQPLIWDNYPVNDYGGWWLNMGPLQGRDAELDAHAEGVVSNPMNQAHATLIPLQTVADYLWNTRAYNAPDSRTHAVASQYGPDGPALLAPLLTMYTADSGGALAFRSIFQETWDPVDLMAIEKQTGTLDALVTNLRKQPGFEKLASELAPLAESLHQQMKRVRGDPAFLHLPEGKIQWDRGRDILRSASVSGKIALDGEFSKWPAASVVRLNDKGQVVDGADLWQGPAEFSARVALAWDESNLYFGVDVTEPNLFQPFTGRGIQNGDAFHLIVDTSQPIAAKQGRPAGVYDFYLSPGNFADVKPSLYCNEDFFPPRARVHHYDQEIQANWKKTTTGYSGDIVIPAAFFDRGKFETGQEIGLSFEAQKVFPSQDPLEEDSPRIVFSSKGNSLFPVESQNPTTLQRLQLIGPR